MTVLVFEKKKVIQKGRVSKSLRCSKNKINKTDKNKFHINFLQGFDCTQLNYIAERLFNKNENNFGDFYRNICDLSIIVGLSYAGILNLLAIKKVVIWESINSHTTC